MKNAYTYVQRAGIATDRNYPYMGRVGTCHDDKTSFKILNYRDIYDCYDLDRSLKQGPIAVAVDGSHFHSYSIGVFDNCSTNINLPVLLVGVNDIYYTLKNSWGKKWGEDGYIRLRYQDNICGICSYGYYPIV